ncbi:MAG: insulinase family protein [Gemmatimonadaceae bacterium]|nr:insulinase family protein [Gemmatimonadaceae bacterium]
MRRFLLLPSIALLAPAALRAQAAFDRTKVPTLPPAPRLVLPSVATSRLANGIGLQVVSQREVPLVQVTLSITGGARLDGDQPGLASFTARMLTESAGGKDVNELQNAIAFLGATLNSSASWDAFTVSLNVPRRSLDAALALMADVVQRPAFTSADVRRQRDLRAAGILQRRDQPGAIATLAFNGIVFPAGHPYHNPADGDSAATARLDSARVRAFYQRAYVPSRARFIVAGDISTAEAATALASHFGSWSSAERPAPVTAVAVRPVSNTAGRVFLVDKPGAAQSIIVIGAPGVSRLSPDYPALVVMNTLLGASFSSRLNTNLRETKGYTYGIGSGFGWQPLPGAFRISSGVRTDVTDSSLVEVFRELRAIRDAPVDAGELARGKAYVALGIPGSFETNGEIAGQLAELNQFGLPLSSVSAFIARVNAVTAADVQRVARRYLPVDRATIVVVGDLAKVRAGVEALKLGPVTQLEVTSVAK